MLTKLTDTISLAPLANPCGRRLFQIPSGTYAGRFVAIFLSAPGELRLTFADPPYSGWSTPTIIATDCLGYSFDSAILPDGSLHIAYIASSGTSVITRHLTFAGGAWTPASPVTAYSGSSCLDPCLAVDLAGRLWLAWTRLVDGTRHLHCKSSIDNGATWGTGPSDLGDSLATTNTFLVSRLIAAPETLHALIAFGSTKLSIRSIALADGSWSDEYVIADGTSGFNEQFDTALGPNGRLAVVYNDSHFRFREFDGHSWSAAVTITDSIQNSPQVVYRDGAPHIFWLQSVNGLQKTMMYSSRLQGAFHPPAVLDHRASYCDTVLLYNATSGTYANLTDASASLATADIVHPVTNRLVRDTGDAVFIGMDERFRYLQYTLSTVGAGGTVAYSYWDGAAWLPMIPASGLAHLDSAQLRVSLWNDYQAIPANWQRKTIAGHNRFWIKCEVTSAFSTGPIGSQLTTISELGALNLWR